MGKCLTFEDEAWGHLRLLCNAIAIYLFTSLCVQKALNVTVDQNIMDFIGLLLGPLSQIVKCYDRKPCSLHVYHEIHCRISVSRPAHLFIKVISNMVTTSQTQRKLPVTLQSLKRRPAHLYHWFRWWLIEIPKQQNCLKMAVGFF